MRFKSKVAAFVATAALVAALPGAALAATNTTSVPAFDGADEMKVVKTYNWNDGTYDSTAFKFHVEYTGYESQGVYDSPKTAPVCDKDFEIAVPEDKDALTNKADKLLTAILDRTVTFDTPGVYKFLITEINGTNNNIKYNVGTNKYTVKVQVDNQTTEGTGVTKDIVEITSITVYDKAGDKVADGEMDFLNDKVDAGDLKITKTITGNAANPNDKFQFTVTFSGDFTGTYKYIGKIGGQDVNGTFDPSSAFTKELGNGDFITFKNLPQGVDYNVNENKGQYKATYVQNDGESADLPAAGVDGEIDNDGEQVDVTNDKSEEIITGYLMAIAPYALMLALVAAAAAAFVVSRRRADSVRF